MSDNVYSSPVPHTDEGFVPPKGSPPRERYFTRTTKVPTRLGCWQCLKVEVFWRSTKDSDDEVKVAEYEHNYPSLRETFEPFRQNGRDYALVSTHHTATSVLDLQTGNIIAAEAPHTFGFCPIEFYVPDWWDIHAGGIMPGDEHWELSDSWPRGDFGFVAGCVWGDEYYRKIQYLDLSRITEGVIARDERFGYVELPTDVSLRDAVQLDTECRSVSIAVAMSFSLETGKLRHRPDFLDQQ